MTGAHCHVSLRMSGLVLTFVWCAPYLPDHLSIPVRDSPPRLHYLWGISTTKKTTPGKDLNPSWAFLSCQPPPLGASVWLYPQVPEPYTSLTTLCDQGRGGNIQPASQPSLLFVPTVTDPVSSQTGLTTGLLLWPAPVACSSSSVSFGQT